MPYTDNSKHNVSQTTPKLHQVSKLSMKNTEEESHDRQFKTLILQICKSAHQNSAKRSYLEQHDNHGRNEERRNRKLQEAAKVEDNWKHLETYRIDVDDDDDDAG